MAGVPLASRGVSPPWLAAAIGASWGVIGYAMLWGLTPIVIHRAFVVSPVGTLLLLPVRGVLLAIHLVELRIVGRPFELSDNHGWIAVTSAAIGAAMATATFLSVRAAARWFGRRSAS